MLWERHGFLKEFDSQESLAFQKLKRCVQRTQDANSFIRIYIQQLRCKYNWGDLDHPGREMSQLSE